MNFMNDYPIFTVDAASSVAKYNGYTLYHEETPTVTFDLSTLGLGAGTHEITVRAKASGYADSAKSNALNYFSEGETYELGGTWVFNDTISFENVEGNVFADLNFYSNGSPYIGIDAYGPEDELIIYDQNGGIGDPTEVYYGRWYDQAHRTITLDGIQTVSKKFYDWFTANAEEEIMFFVDDGLTVRGIRGMKWHQWAVSVYNTVGYGLKWDDGIVGRPELAYIIDVGTGIPIVSEDGEIVTGDMEIIEGHSYGHYNPGGSN